MTNVDRTKTIWLITGAICVPLAIYLARLEDDSQVITNTLAPIFGDGWFSEIVLLALLLALILAVFGATYGVDKLLFRRSRTNRDT